MEAAIALAAVLVVVVLCLGAVMAASMNLRCVDAAREAARLAARGDPAAVSTGRRIAPAGAAVTVRADGDGVVARVSARVTMLPGLTVRAEAFAAREADPVTGEPGRWDQ